MKRQIEPKDVPLLNLILDRDPTLAAMVLGRLDALDQALGPVPTTPQPAAPSGPQTPPTPDTKTAEIQARVLDWFKTHAGKHALSAIRKDLGVADGSKPFKTAVQNLIADKLVKGSGKVGRGAEYWLA